jgi:hypothetical protein
MKQGLNPSMMALEQNPITVLPEIDQKVLAQNPSFKNWGFWIFVDL